MRIRRDRALLFSILVVAALVLVACEAVGGVVGGDRSSPENVARAYMKALSEGDCAGLKEVVASDNWYKLDDHCNGAVRIESVQIDEAIVRDAPCLGCGVVKEVSFIGTLVYTFYSSHTTKDNWKVWAEQVDDDTWYILPGLGIVRV
jgi:hypothetical protein